MNKKRNDVLLKKEIENFKKKTDNSYLDYPKKLLNNDYQITLIKL